MTVDKSRTLFYSEIIINEGDGYEYSADKEKWLIEERGISFKEVIAAINNGQVLKVMDHHNQTKYPTQKIYVIEMNGYVCAVPFVEKGKHIVFLKTIFKNRKLAKKYLHKSDKGEAYEKENKKSDG